MGQKKPIKLMLEMSFRDLEMIVDALDTVVEVEDETMAPRHYEEADEVAELRALAKRMADKHRELVDAAARSQAFAKRLIGAAGEAA